MKSLAQKSGRPFLIICNNTLPGQTILFGALKLLNMMCFLISLACVTENIYPCLKTTATSLAFPLNTVSSQLLKQALYQQAIQRLFRHKFLVFQRTMNWNPAV